MSLLCIYTRYKYYTIKRISWCDSYIYNNNRLRAHALNPVQLMVYMCLCVRALCIMNSNRKKSSSMYICDGHSCSPTLLTTYYTTRILYKLIKAFACHRHAALNRALCVQVVPSLKIELIWAVLWLWGECTTPNIFMFVIN